MIYALAGAAFALFFFLGFAQSHWIAPGVLFLVSAPLIIGPTWDSGSELLAVSLGGTLALYYAAFALGQLIARSPWSNARSPNN
jgi:hypothetical protein